ncbi:hypothetical protein [Arthrobacter sp. GMC3]|uniref:hypothetical protein n=1 Tax=Arthrobacter sp. GMC3 TaxID=2058894 RepID=UPI000CE457BE|nr:hypothetical protein [Arthrobacter sp. GMC3]
MSKFKVGDHVRVTTDAGVTKSYFDVVGMVDDLRSDQGHGVGVHFEALAPLWFAEHELVLAEATR